MDFRGFFAAIFTDWVSLMSGIASVVLTILGVVRKWETFPRRALWIAALICFFIAAARVWTAEHRARLAAEQHLEELTIPKLRGGITFLAIAPATMGSVITVVATIWNDGAQSYAEKFSLVMKSEKQEKKLLPLIPSASDPYVISEVNAKAGLRFEGSDYLPRACKSIAFNGKAEGFFPVVTDVPFDELRSETTIYTLNFSDAKGKRYSAVYRRGAALHTVNPLEIQKK